MINRKKHSVLIRILLLIILSAVIIFSSFIVFSSNIGDYYFGQKEYERSFALYNLSYTVFNKHETLVKIYYALELAEGIDVEELEYYPLLLDDQMTKQDKTLYGLVLTSYLKDLYDIGEFSEFKDYYHDHLNSLLSGENYILILSPIVDITNDANASNEMLVWSIDIVNKIIGIYKTNNTKSFGYYLQSIVYEKLGDTVKSQELLELSRSIPKNDEIE